MASEAVLAATPVAEATLAVEAVVVKNATSVGKSAILLGTALKAAEADTEGATIKAAAAAATVAGMEQEQVEQAVEAKPATPVEAMDICLVSENTLYQCRPKAKLIWYRSGDCTQGQYVDASKKTDLGTRD